MKSMYIATAVTYILCSMISIIVMLWQILFDMVTIMFDYDCFDCDYIVSHSI
jgi:hypothetical protein